MPDVLLYPQKSGNLCICPNSPYQATLLWPGCGTSIGVAKPNYTTAVAMYHCYDTTLCNDVIIVEGLEHTQEDDEEKVLGLEKLLGAKLAEFLDADYSYTMSQIPSSVRPHLYKGLSTTDSATGSVTAQGLPPKLPATKTTDAEGLPAHLAKGGSCITDYLTYDW